MARWLQDVHHRLVKAWMAVQVEFQGHYSVERLKQLDAFSKTLSTGRMIAVFLLTPVPCLVLSVLKEMLPLNPAEAGVYNNDMFFIRSWLVTGLIGASALVKMGQGSPRLKLNALQLAVVSLLSAGVAVMVIYGICAATVFPLPFGILVVAPPEVLMLAACFAYIFGPRLRAEPSLWNDINQQVSVYNCQVALTFIYPLYIFGFVSLTGVNQALFVLVLPIIKLIAKNSVSRALADYDDVKPQYVIFIVEVFNALYVSSALQSASSWTLTATIMVIDVVHFWVSMRDVMEIFNEMKMLMANIPQDHPIAKENFLQVVLRVLAVESEPNDEVQEQVSGALFSKTERAHLIKKSTRVLFITEYIVLVEYVEVVIPIVYSIYRVALFNLPNSAYFDSMAGLTSAQLLSSVLNVLAYSSLEFVSLILSIIILNRALGLSTLRQLAFVLETHAGMIQATLIDILIYVTQISLAHLGKRIANCLLDDNDKYPYDNS
ncbi:hypothetical protein BBO99_00007810 [Phytophthora kernoviae]|uniref:Uncharacterized protein n=2 Tax=Phytophthora kernoviae TaxID=325452 RepID=A0A421GGQ4_9STRA|nr:hypothetical protein G195_008985 [Phytophthora kernoviae 00238/432]KAG2519260.1 hypothetical protein JM16_007226 [Phytophthora kernoviae]KAG2520374.1 hypothetical protein JM18_007151 [Phytophthora kernoviae]RLN45378.1 hypothetical protein BBI17_007588 [Phytophthora kernoviae]RLN76094.1 hypothetical protein BBO99_00007810 [Phytophthora kernoviae]